MWIVKIITSLWAVTNSFSYFIMDPAQAPRWFKPAATSLTSPASKRHKKCTHSSEREKKAKEDHDNYVAGQVAKGDKWDRWEVSPPTVNVFNNYINPTFNTFNTFNTFISTCPATPDVPGVDATVLAKKYRPTIGDELVIDKNAVYKEAGMVWLGHVLSTFLFSVLIYIVFSTVVKVIKVIYRFFFL
ncbi:hypothetical protein E8E13_005138 [Curvularia kusanoi]|uniref:Uncharacterized protein n=1 Tax=Curvularia kusanoi TaxID=90978 RepID=A0A9P4TAY2_CURKU|nr:hypothetical protein E8E13_005138 [Curvularia kusanoi]